MGADNWANCPQCKSNAVKELLKKRKKAADSYGKIPPEKWMTLNAESNTPIGMQATVREDYELGITEDGEFYVIYSGSCSKCGLSKKFKHSEQLVEVTQIEGAE